MMPISRRLENAESRIVVEMSKTAATSINPAIAIAV